MATESELVFGVWKNPHNKEFIRNLLIMAIVLFSFFLFLAVVFALYGGHFDYGFYIWLFIAIFISSLLLLGIIVREYIQRPKYIEIQPSGILTTSQWGSKRFIPWNWMKYVFTYSYSGNPKLYYSQREAFLFTLDASISLLICLDVVKRIILAYKGMTGFDLKIIYDD